MLDVSVGLSSREVRGGDLQLRRNRNELGTVDHLAGVYPENGHFLEGGLERGLDLLLVTCKRRYMRKRFAS